MNKYFKNSRNYFFLTLFLILLVQLIKLWSQPLSIQESKGEIIASEIRSYDTEMETFITDPFIDTLSRENSLLKRSMLWEKFINRASENNFSTIIYVGGKVRYWSLSSVMPDYNYLKLKDGNNFRNLDNGWYIIKQRTINNSKVLCLLNISKEYSYQNEYLTNRYNSRLSFKKYLEVTTDPKVEGYMIRDNSDKVLFKIVVNETKLKSSPSYLLISVWLLVFICGYLSVNNLAKHLWAKGESLASVLFIIFAVLVFRFISMYWMIPHTIYQLPVFSPEKYASSFVFPSLGDLIINLLLLHWIIYFLFDKIKELNFRVYKAKMSYLLTVIFILSSYFFIDLLNYLFEGLVMNSNISFELTNILSLNVYSIAGFFVLSLMLYSFYLYIDTIISIFHQFFLSKREKLNVFLITVAVIFIGKSLVGEMNILFYTNTLFIIILERAKSRKKDYLSLPFVVLIMCIFGIASSSRLLDFNTEKEKQNRQLLASKLESANDPIAEYLLEGLVNKLKEDAYVKRYFSDRQISNESLDTRVQQLYFGGYFSKYDLSLYEFDVSGKPIRQTLTKDISHYDDIIKSKSTPTFNPYFYYQSNTYGILTYYGKIPLYQDGNLLGHLIIELKSKYFRDENIFPELLLEGSLKLNKDFKAYSYSIYRHGKLISQQGEYPYSLQDIEFAGAKEGYTFISNSGYDHLIYKPTKDLLIVVSQMEESPLKILAIFSYLFGLFSLFFLLFYVRRLIGKRINFLSISFKDVRNFRVLFKTRIQLSMVLTIIFSLGLVGYITFLYITDQYTKQQNERLSQKVRSILISLERRSSLINYWKENYDDRMSIELKSLSDLYLTDINIYDLNGKLLISTQPKIFEQGLVSRYMNPSAYMVMKRYERSEFSADEKIGTLHYLSSYAPIRNSNNKTVGYLNLPYFANKSEYESRVSQFITTFVNVYVFIFVAIGFIAFFIANSITFPLTLIEEQLRETKIGKKMDPIDWKGRDEIGRLITEFNRMIYELEESTDRLAKSERENAWREMAKQVAHEIKNPLTPIKLGLQHLHRAWLDKDPQFDEKFERFNKTIIQQIESLSLIASEFSNFAQMPLAKNEKVDIKDLVSNVIDLYKNENDIEISLGFNPSLRSLVLADKDQMIRTFNNLIKNAIQAIPSQRIGKIDVELINERNDIIVVIQDNGIGMDEEMQEKIFRPNFTTKNSGMGMGLAIVNNIIINAGGKIWFNSALNKGTTFYVSLPLYKEE